VETELTLWLSDAGRFAFRVSAALFVALNLAAAAVFLTWRDRSLVQRWTSPWLAANLILIGTGAGIPALAAMARIVVYAFAGAAGTLGVVPE
jgi:hypothetical protein